MSWVDVVYISRHLLPSFPLALSSSVIIHKNGVETVAFRHAGKSQDKVGGTGPILKKHLDGFFWPLLV